GTIGVLVQVTLRCQPRVRFARWFTTGADPFEARRRMFRPSCIAWDGATTRVLLEGHSDDVAAEARAAGLETVGGAPAWPDGAHRGRISVRPSRLQDLAPALDEIDGLGWLAEVGVGTVHVAAEEPVGLVAARAAAGDREGWLRRGSARGGRCAGAGPHSRPHRARPPRAAAIPRVRLARRPD